MGVGVAVGLLEVSDRFEVSVDGGFNLNPSNIPSQFRFSLCSPDPPAVGLDAFAEASEVSTFVFALRSPNMDFFVPESLAGRSLPSVFGLELERFRLGNQPFRAGPDVSVDDAAARVFVSDLVCDCCSSAEDFVFLPGHQDLLVVAVEDSMLSVELDTVLLEVDEETVD